MIKRLLSIYFLLSIYAVGAQTLDCNIHKVYCAIKKLSPRLDHNFTKKLSDLMYVEANKLDLDPIVSVAIAMQESSFRHIVKKHTGVNIKSLKGPKQTIITDIGIFQINAATALDYKLDVMQIKNSLSYAVKSHFKILKSKQKVCINKLKVHRDNAWSCYHSYTPKYRRKYLRDVSRHLNKIK